ncbi:caspase family protein [Mycolicibacterium litorale]|uniref:caspase family protein n=1 Tax=Mycolicibacterium litorale TaxID=758802 RepID=UPI003CEBC4F9
MTRRSLHIGLNHVDPHAYGGWDGALSGCINDANSMQQVALSRGFEPEQLIDGQATADSVRRRLDAAANELTEGDFFFLTYSGHGGQVVDMNADEQDSLDETWCLFDTELVDDSLYGALCAFQPGVRIFVMSDSCHSETVTRAPVARAREERAAAVDGRAKRAPLDVTLREFEAHKDDYTAQQKWWKPVRTPKDAAASVVLIAGCKDDETSMDGPVNGAFTAAFLDVWGNGDYQGDYEQLAQEVRAKLDGTGQTPSIFFYGANVTQMLAETPLGELSQTSGAAPIG